MARESMRVYFSKGKRHEVLTCVTAVFFVLLVAEKFTECISPAFWQSGTDISLTLSFGDFFSMAVYLSMFILILLKVDYKYLLIPDGLLFISKFIHVLEGFGHLFPLNDGDILTQVTAIEEIVDNFLFMVFLMIFFSGKIIKKLAGYIKFLIPYVCILSLVLTFPTTVVLETIKVLIEAEFYAYSVSAMAFIFVRAIAREIFLDIPYFLLVMLVYYKPHQK